MLCVQDLHQIENFKNNKLLPLKYDNISPSCACGVYHLPYEQDRIKDAIRHV